MQKKMQLKGEAGNLTEAGNIIKLPKGGCITPTELGSIMLKRSNSVWHPTRDAQRLDWQAAPSAHDIHHSQRALRHQLGRVSG